MKAEKINTVRCGACRSGDSSPRGAAFLKHVPAKLGNAQLTLTWRERIQCFCQPGTPIWFVLSEMRERLLQAPPAWQKTALQGQFAFFFGALWKQILRNWRLTNTMQRRYWYLELQELYNWNCIAWKHILGHDDAQHEEASVLQEASDRLQQHYGFCEWRGGPCGDAVRGHSLREFPGLRPGLPESRRSLQRRLSDGIRAGLELSGLFTREGPEADPWRLQDGRSEHGGRRSIPRWRILCHAFQHTFHRDDWVLASFITLFYGVESKGFDVLNHSV